MAQIPTGLEGPQLKGLRKIHDGKVRATYTGVGKGKLLQLSTDRCSIFNFVLNGQVKQKGEILTALTVFWLTKVLMQFPSHLLAYGNQIDEYLPKDLRDLTEVKTRALIIEKLTLAQIEAIVRFFLTGSGWESFQQTGNCYGHPVPANAWNGMELPYPIFTPTEKSDTDPWIHHDKVAKLYGAGLERTALQIACMARAYAQSRGLDLLDMKLELNRFGKIGDEVLTPDSCRLVDLLERMEMAKNQKLASSLDKQFVRNWGNTKGINKLDASNPEHIALVQSYGLPDDVAANTAQIYRYVFYRLVGKKLEKFQYENMGIVRVHPPKLKIGVVIGSRSDLVQCQQGLKQLEKYQEGGAIDLEVNILSCHRNSSEVEAYALLTKADVLVSGAGMAAALPGILKAWLNKAGKKTKVIGVAFEGKTPRETLAAQLSIEELPGKPVILDDQGKAFTGSDGFLAACMLAVNAEFKPEKNSEGKKPELDIRDYMLNQA